MPFDDHTPNLAYSLVATAPSPATTGLSLIVTAGQGALFPTPPFNATVWASGAQPITTNAEIVRVTKIATDTLTIVRAQESTSARTVVVGDQIAATITAKTLTDVEAGFSPDLPLAALAPPRNQTIPAGYGVVVPDYYELAAARDANTTTPVPGVGAFSLNDPVGYAAQSFAATDNYSLIGVALYLGVTGAPADNLTVELRTDSAGFPSASVLGTANISAATVTSTAWYSATFTVAVTYGVTYWIVAYRTGISDFSNLLNWKGTVASSYSGGFAANSGDSGATWGSLSGAVGDFLFQAVSPCVTEIGAGSILAVTA